MNGIMKTMRMSLPLICLLSLTACAPDDSRVADIQEQLDAKNIRIVELNKEIQATHQEGLDNLTALKTRHAERTQALERKIEQLESEITLKSDRISELTSELREARKKRASRKAVVKPTMRPATVAPPDLLAEEKDPGVPAARRGGLPIRVFAITGKQVVTGSHESGRFVKFDKPRLDEEGNEVLGEWQPEEKKEYGYKAFFSLENPGTAALKVVVRAGVASEELIVAPGTTTEGMSIDAAKGSDLRVTVNGRSKSFSVEYGK